MDGVIAGEGADAAAAVPVLDGEVDVVVNSRYAVGGREDRVGNGGPLQLVLSKTLNWSICFLLEPSFCDHTSGFMAVRRHVLGAVPLRGDYGEYFHDFMYRALRGSCRVGELPHFAPPRRSGESRTGQHLVDYLRRGRKYLWAVAKAGLEAAHQGHTLALIVRRKVVTTATTFVTDGDAQLRLGFIVYPGGATIARLVHGAIERRVTGRPEAIVMRSGRCEVDIDGDTLVRDATRELAAGDVVLLLDGGHGFRLLDGYRAPRVQAGSVPAR